MKRNCIGSVVRRNFDEGRGEISFKNTSFVDFSHAFEMTKEAFFHSERSEESKSFRLQIPPIVGMTKLLIFALVLASCQTKPKKDHHDIGKVTVDSSLKALIAPSNEQVVAKAAVVKASYETKIFTAEVQGIVNYDTRSETSVASRVGGRLEKLYIKYNYQPVKKGQLLFEIYAPDLAAAQQELIYLSQSEGDERLLVQAKQRLSLLGMSNQTIQQLLQSKKVNYRISVYSPADGYILEKQLANNNASSSTTAMNTESSKGDGMSGMSGGGGSATPSAVPIPQVDNSPVMLREGQYVNAGQALFTVYKADQLLAEFTLKSDLAGFVKKGSKLALYKTADREGSFETSQIGLIQPIIKAGENFTLARVYLKGNKFKAGEILTAKIPVMAAKSYWLPESAVVNMGTQSIAFKKENGVFVNMNLNVGLRMNGMVQIKDPIGDWEFAKHGAYLVDSESFIRAKQTIKE